MTDKINITKILPQEYKKLGSIAIEYGIVSTKFGKVLVGMNEDKVCYISFVGGDDGQKELNDLKSEFPKAVISENIEKITPEAENIFSDERSKEINILLKGTAFETTVWEQLVSLKKGSTFSYEDVAKAIENPKAIRAVAKAVTKNKLAYCVPCHRVISKSGGLSKYKWGSERKLKILKEENAI